MKLHGQLFEVTRFGPFVRQYLAHNSRPGQDSIRPVRDACVGLYRCDLIGSRPLVESHSDEAGRYEIDLSVLPATSVFLVASGGSECWYRSSHSVAGTIGEGPLDIYVARQAIPHESGFSQAELAAVLSKTKERVVDLEQIAGTITGNGIALTCTGKGARASGRLVLRPNDSSNLNRILRHSIEDFHLELPGPSWLVGLMVSRDAIEASIRAGLQDLAVEIDSRLHLRAAALFTEQVRNMDPVLADRLAGETTLTLSRLHDAPASGSASSQASRTIIGEVCLGFPRTLESRDSRL